MSEKTYWRGYVDGQNQKDYLTDLPIATAPRSGLLKPLSALINIPIVEYRSGYMIKFDNLNKSLPKKIDEDYIRGWFKAQGRIYKQPSLKLTVIGTNVSDFITAASKFLNIEYPKPQMPSKTSRSLRITFTGEKARLLKELIT